MKRFLLFLGLIIFYLSIIPCRAQSQTWHLGISENDINVRGNPVVVGELNIDVPETGNVLVHFDGLCIADVGDIIVLAASNTPNWGINDGNVNVEPANADVDRGTFSHTRKYQVSPGNYTFYAVAENYFEQGGNGRAYIYASLTVKFFPYLPDVAMVGLNEISKTNINLRGAPVVVGLINITVSEPGKAVVHFDGHCYPDVGDRIVLAASNTPSWGVNDGNVAVEAVDSDVNSACFSHTRVYDVVPGSTNFYAVAENFVELGGNGIAHIYGSLTVEYFPDLPDIAFAEHQGINKTNINLRGAPVVVGQININVTEPGKAVVHFDGSCYPDVGDLIVLAASNTPSWGINDGNVGVKVVNSDINNASFSHTRVYNITAGSHDFYAVAENYVDLGGTGIADLYASLTVEFFPDIISEVQHSNEIITDYTLEQNFPNPFNPTTIIKYQIPALSFVTVKVYDVLGNEVATLVNEEKQVGSYEVNFEGTGLPSGIYFYRLQAGSFVETKKMVLMK